MDHVRYIDKTRDYYLKEGYDKPYEWAHFETVPFTPLPKPLADCRVGLLSTSEIAVRFDPETEADPIKQEGFRGVYEFAADTPLDKLYSNIQSYDRHATHMDDVNSYIPIVQLRQAVADGRVGGMADRIYCAHNNYSQRKTLEQDGPAVLDYCREDGIDAVILVPV